MDYFAINANGIDLAESIISDGPVVTNAQVKWTFINSSRWFALQINQDKYMQMGFHFGRTTGPKIRKKSQNQSLKQIVE